MMDLSYFLEMVDVKHRYGSYLRKYHAEWKSRPTNENFFYWLDQGEGKDVEVEKCSRERLEKMQVRYLGREERRYYEVIVDREGKLCWRKDGVRVDVRYDSELISQNIIFAKFSYCSLMLSIPALCLNQHVLISECARLQTDTETLYMALSK